MGVLSQIRGQIIKSAEIKLGLNGDAKAVAFPKTFGAGKGSLLFMHNADGSRTWFSKSNLYEMLARDGFDIEEMPHGEYMTLKLSITRSQMEELIKSLRRNKSGAQKRKSKI